MMSDDFSALDLLSIGAYRLSSTPVEPYGKPKKKRFGTRRQAQSSAKNGLSEFLPMIGRKLRRPMKSRGFQGWPMRLSWAPSQDLAPVDLWSDHGSRPLS